MLFLTERKSGAKAVAIFRAVCYTLGMGKKKQTNVYEDKQTKEEKRIRKEREYFEKHGVKCPHCGKDVLDHMTKCPSCGGNLQPKGYKPLSDKTILIIKIVGFVVGMAIVIPLLIFVFNK